MDDTKNINFKKDEDILQKCCERRSRLYELLRKSMDEGSGAYDQEMKKLRQEIDSLMSQIDSWLPFGVIIAELAVPAIRNDYLFCIAHIESIRETSIAIIYSITFILILSGSK